MARKVKRIRPKDYELSTVQDNCANLIDQLLTAPDADKRLIEDQALTTGGDNVISHKLGRALVGWVPVRVSAQCQLWQTDYDDKTLSLRTSANATVSLLVF